MKYFENNKSLKSFLGLLIILSVFIAGFQIISIIYSYRGNESYLTSLDQEIFSKETAAAKNSPFTVDKIVRFALPFSIKDYDLMDINKIVFVSSDLRNSPYDYNAGIYDLAKGELNCKLDQKAKSYQSTVTVSPDGKMILTSYSGKQNEPGKTYLYNVAMKRNLLAINNLYMVEWIPDSSEFVGVDEYLFVQDAKTGKRENLQKISDYINKDQENIQVLKVLKDGRTICLIYRDKNGNYGIVSVDRVTGIWKQVNVALGMMYMPTVISDKNFATIGIMNGKYGIYSYDLKHNTYLQLVDMSLGNQKIGDFCVSSDGTKIAYCVVKNDGVEIHAAALENNKLKNDEVVYKDNNFIGKLVWTKDGRMLYCCQQNIDSTMIYRILFENSENTK